MIKEFSSKQKDELQMIDDAFFKLLFSAEHDIEKYRGTSVKNNPQHFISSL